MPLPWSEDVEQLVTDEPTDGRNVSHAWAQPEAPNTVSGAGDEFVEAPPNATHLSRVGGNGHTAPLPAKSQQKHKYGPAPLPERLEKLKGSALQKHEEAQKVKERARERVPHGGLHVNENGGTYTTSFTLKYHCIAYLNLRITTRPYSYSFFITLN